jgi:hypothetical protein
MEQSAGITGHQVNRHHCLRTSGFRGDPGQFHTSIAIQTEKSAVVGMPRTFEMGVEKDGGIDFALHQHRAWGGKPAVELCALAV